MDLPVTAPPTAPASDPPLDLCVTLPDGRRMGYADYGDPRGLPILGFHGTPGSRLMFRLAHEPARELGIRLLAPERPGFGISSPQRGRTLASYALDIADFADTLGIAHFAVAGISGGGPYAAACAALLPERVTALGLVSPVGPMAGEERPRAIGPGHYFAFRVTPRLPPLLAGMFGIGRCGFLYAPKLIYGFLMSRAAPSDWKILARPEVRRNLLAGVAEGCRPGIRAGMQELGIFSRPWHIPLNEIAAPAFLWQGLADRNISIPAALGLGALIPHCRVETIEKAGHYWIFDNIARVLSTLSGAAKADLARLPDAANAHAALAPDAANTDQP
ncbi:MULTISPECIES: alpha/beta hydrolase [Rhodomicrobium]|uniref:alpha/beta fold hydrolase n=1 Tax=Rhodomicrobium TaxID=1068 RepID=UPI000B4B1D16|nr:MULTISPECIES: alpha/beta hydrolase [Rhodomicrobium]